MTKTPPDTRLSQAIRIARTLCILGVVYIHAWTGLAGDELAASDATLQGALRWTLMELGGRAAVPLLGMVAGWLVVDSLAKRPTYGAFVAHKAKTIALPMVLWNLLAVVLVSGAAMLGMIRAPSPDNAPWLINELFSVQRPNDINVQMPFLRDLFVCMVAAPVLLRLSNAALGLVFAAALAWTVVGLSFELLLRPSVLVFFLAGVLMRRAGAERWLAARPLAATAAAYLALAGLATWMSFQPLAASGAWQRDLLDLLFRFASAAFFWSVAWRLAGRPAGKRLAALEPYVFLTFCSHLIMIWLAGPLIGRLTGPLGSPLYPVFLVAQPFLVMAAATVLGRALSRLSPAIAYTLSGQRLARPA